MPITDEAKAALATAAAAAAEQTKVEAAPTAGASDDMFVMEDLQDEKPWRKNQCRAQRDGHSKNSKKGTRQAKKDRKAKSAKRG